MSGKNLAINCYKHERNLEEWMQLSNATPKKLCPFWTCSMTVICRVIVIQFMSLGWLHLLVSRVCKVSQIWSPFLRTLFSRNRMNKKRFVKDLKRCRWFFKLFKVHRFWEGHNILRNLQRRFVLCSNGQIFSGDFAKFWVWTLTKNWFDTFDILHNLECC